MTEVAVRLTDKHVMPETDLIDHIATPHCPCEPEPHKAGEVWAYLHNPFTDVEVQYTTEEAEQGCQ